MNHDLEQLGATLKRDNAWNLSVPEKEAMRAAILARTASLRASSAVPSPYLSYFLRRNALIAAALIIALLGSGTSVALAGNALPGDTLYAVKTDIAEPVERALALGSRAKAAVEIRQAEERLREVALLAADERPRLSEAAEDAAERIAKARERIANLKDADIDARFSFALSAQADLLEAQAKGEDEEDDAESLSALARTAREGDHALLASAERAGELIAKAYEKLAKKDLQEDTRAELLAELSRIDSRFADATIEGSLRSLIGIERGAYRVMALADAAERIRDSGKKGVLVRFRERLEERAKTKSAPAGATLMMAAESSSVEDTSRSSDDEERSRDEDEDEDEDEEETELEFRVLDLEPDDDEEEDKDSSGHGSSGDQEDEDEEEDHSGKDGG